MVKDYSFPVFFEQLDEGGYMAIVPALPGLVTYGKDLDEARRMVREAIRCHVEGLIRDGEPVPEIDLDRSEPIREVLQVGIPAA